MDVFFVSLLKCFFYRTNPLQRAASPTMIRMLWNEREKNESKKINERFFLFVSKTIFIILVIETVTIWLEINGFVVYLLANFFLFGCGAWNASLWPFFLRSAFARMGLTTFSTVIASLGMFSEIFIAGEFFGNFAWAAFLLVCTFAQMLAEISQSLEVHPTNAALSIRSANFMSLLIIFENAQTYRTLGSVAHRYCGIYSKTVWWFRWYGIRCSRCWFTRCRWCRIAEYDISNKLAVG